MCASNKHNGSWITRYFNSERKKIRMIKLGECVSASHHSFDMFYVLREYLSSSHWFFNRNY